VICALTAAPLAVLGNVHTVFTTECGTYFVWQALGGLELPLSPSNIQHNLCTA
jgi:hypothetical protein